MMISLKQENVNVINQNNLLVIIYFFITFIHEYHVYFYFKHRLGPKVRSYFRKVYSVEIIHLYMIIM